MFLHILHMSSFKKLALIATEILGKTSAETAETADTATDPKTIPPAIFQKRAGGKKASMSYDSRFYTIDLFLHDLVSLLPTILLSQEADK